MARIAPSSASMVKKAAHTGKLISFEGSEGSGKTSQIARLAERLQRMGRDVVTVREPGGTEIGEQIRNIIVHNSKGDEMCPETELLLFAAARAQLVREAILPALVRGAIVLSDRYLDSRSEQFQGGREVPGARAAPLRRRAGPARARGDPARAGAGGHSPQRPLPRLLDRLPGDRPQPCARTGEPDPPPCRRSP